MNILILTNHLNRGGITTYVVNAAQGLEKKGHQVWIASQGGEMEHKVLHRVLNIKGKNAFSLHNLRQLKALGTIIADISPDIIWAHTRITMVLSDLASRRWKIPYITTFHGFFHPKLSRVLFKAEGKVAIAVSESVKRHMVKELKISSDKVRLVYNALPKEYLHGLRLKRQRLKDIAKYHLGVADRGFVIGSLSRINPAKGYNTLIDAFERLPSDIWLVIVGQGDEKQTRWLRERITSSKARDRIRWLPYLTDPAIFWAGIDVFALASHREGFGFTLLEAMACGVPIIATRSGGPEEVLGEELKDLLVDVGDSPTLADRLMKLQNDSQFYEIASQRALHRVNKFDFDSFIHEIESIILNVSRRQ